MTSTRFNTQTFHFLLRRLIHYKATLLPDQQNTPERFTLHSTACLTVEISWTTKNLASALTLEWYTI